MRFHSRCRGRGISSMPSTRSGFLRVMFLGRKFLVPVGVYAVGSIQSSVVVMLLRRCMASFRGTCILRVPKGFQLAVHRFLLYWDLVRLSIYLSISSLTSSEIQLKVEKAEYSSDARPLCDRGRRKRRTLRKSERSRSLQLRPDLKCR